MMKAVEHMSFARGIVLEHMLRTEKSSAVISMFELRHEEEVRNLKKRSVDLLLDLHPEFFQRMVDFENWEEAAQYVDVHKDVVFKFWEK
ncbi:MAG TPA: hypothetical protein EYN67_10595 [Flavobacteriales bacterium]|jgi:hypothetical protein|nr:hypothetical protein [Flavobacteriales bacterium]